MDLHLVERLAEDLALQTVDYSVWHWVDLKDGTKVEMWAEWSAEKTDIHWVEQ